MALDNIPVRQNKLTLNTSAIATATRVQHVAASSEQKVYGWKVRSTASATLALYVYLGTSTSGTLVDYIYDTTPAGMEYNYTVPAMGGISATAGIYLRCTSGGNGTSFYSFTDDDYDTP